LRADTKHRMSQRVYRSRAAGAAITISAVAGLIALLAAVVAVFADASVLAGLGMTAYAAPFTYMFVRWLRMGLRVDDDGVTVLNAWRRPHFRWDEIERFELTRPTGRTRVVPIRGKPIIITAVGQSNWTTYYRPRTDTQERRWVEEWNALLAEHRASVV
jgi:hypothetical protein